MYDRVNEQQHVVSEDSPSSSSFGFSNNNNNNATSVIGGTDGVVTVTTEVADAASTTTTTSADKLSSWLLRKTGLSTVHDLTMLTKLELGNCGLTDLPKILPMVVPNLSILFCPKNNFIQVPDLIGQCQKLQMVSFKDCPTITSIHPDALQSQLRWLILTGCNIEMIPDTISRCGPSLQKLMLSGNKLRSLPCASSIACLQKLELARLACNDLETAPIELLQLPNLRWVALSRNPFLLEVQKKSSTSTTTSTDNTMVNGHHRLPILDDPVLDDVGADDDDDHGNILGRGAGGVTRKVTYNGMDVAVKTFAGELTSDGSPQDEKAVSVAAAAAAAAAVAVAGAVLDDGDNNNNNSTNAVQHDPALIRLLGETKKDGALVMELLKGYTALAGPPSMDSCSRDVYDENVTALLTESFCWKIVMDMLRVLWKLHRAGICHGDFYGHNILINPNSESVKLSDFGAAYFYDPADELHGKLISQIELRAYSVLVEELMALHTKVDDDYHNINATTTTVSSRWTELLTACHEHGSTFEKLVDQFLSPTIAQE